MSVEWSELFGLGVSPLEMVVRGTAMYWFLFVLFRLVIIADASQNAMSGEYRSISDGFVLVATIVAWNYCIDALAYLSPRLQKILEPPPLLLIRRGALLRRHMRHELVSEAELKGKLREHGVTDFAEVDRAWMESDGRITVIKRRRD